MSEVTSELSVSHKLLHGIDVDRVLNEHVVFLPRSFHIPSVYLWFARAAISAGSQHTCHVNVKMRVRLAGHTSIVVEKVSKSSKPHMYSLCQYLDLPAPSRVVGTGCS